MSEDTNLADLMPFSKLMGVVITSADASGVSGELEVTADLCTTGEIVHGGALMAFADALGAVGAIMTLPEGAAGTTTIESKTNFLKAANENTVVTGTTTPISVGRRLSVWQTTITRDDGKPVAVVTQTQLVL